MSKEQFQKSIEDANRRSLTNGAANRILQLLQNLRYNNNENSAKRWIWELCQNAKDVCNDTGKVKICIFFDEENGKVVFKHNGKSFSMDNLISLINQVSSKDKGDGTERKSGKFGTGFLTTHLLSEIVDVSGILEIEEGKLSRFNITMDRTGRERNEIIGSLDKTISQLYEYIPLSEGEDIDKDAYNTVFEYELNSEGIEVAQEGLENLRISAPYVLAMLRDIEEICLEATDEVYRYVGECECGLENASVHEISYCSGRNEGSVFVLDLTEDDTTIMISLEKMEHGVFIKPFDKNQPRLFCDFPLIGTETFSFPVIVWSRVFNPTEPRDGIYLNCNSKEKIDDEIVENRRILERACELYKRLLDYVSEKQWDGIYNITCIQSCTVEKWLDKEWMEEVVISKCKDIILHTPIICNSNNEMVELLDYWDDEQVDIISDSDECIRERMWDLLHGIAPNRIMRREDIHNWYYSLWNGCNKYNSKSLIKDVSEYQNIETLQSKLSDRRWQEWLADLYYLINEKKEWSYVNSNQIPIIPNQKGQFCATSNLLFDNNVLAEYKEILGIIGNDCEEWLLHKEVDIREWLDLREYDDEQILTAIEMAIDSVDPHQRVRILFRIIYLYEEGDPELEKQNRICQYIYEILGKRREFKAVPMISKKLLGEACKSLMTMVASKISDCGDVYGLAAYLNKSYEETTKILADFIEFVISNGYDNLINKSTKPILPNQNGKFGIKDNLFLDDEMDELLKELARNAGYDIKEELLEKQICLQLPESRQKRDIDVAQTITRYVNNNRTSKDGDVRNDFKRLLVWMSDNEEKAKEIFPELFTHKHYLYDDDEIAENIKQAQTLNDIMQKFEISSPEKLEEIIRSNFESKVNDERVEITPEILLQYGIDSEEALDNAFQDSNFSSKFIRRSKHDTETYEYVKAILERAKNNILAFLYEKEEYDLNDVQQIANTIFIVKKEGKEIYLLARPSDGGEVRIYYETERELLDYSMDWELWVEDGKSDPEKLTFGKVIKLTGLNRIPLRGM